jgi:hypothetical protein
MKSPGIDARRYAWAHGQALWIVGMPLAAFVEDLRGAIADGQPGLARYVARGIGEACAVVLVLMLFYERPIPHPSVRAAWALRLLEGHELHADCLTLIASPGDVPLGELAERAERLVAGVRQVTGEIPDLLTPEGYFPALALARDWLQLLGAVGEEGFLPKDWTRGR